MASELDRLRVKASETTDQSLESTRRMKELVIEADQAGAKTMEMLNTQEAQLNNVERGLHKIHNDVSEADRALTEMEKSMWRFIFCKCCGMCRSTNKTSWVQPDHKIPKGEKRNQDLARLRRSPAKNNGNVDGLIQKITNDEREDEMDSNLQDVSNLLGNMKNMAKDMGTSLARQNQQLDRVNELAEKDEIKLNEAIKRAKNLGS